MHKTFSKEELNRVLREFTPFINILYLPIIRRSSSNKPKELNETLSVNRIVEGMLAISNSSSDESNDSNDDNEKNESVEKLSDGAKVGECKQNFKENKLNINY